MKTLALSALLMVSAAIFAAPAFAQSNSSSCHGCTTNTPAPVGQNTGIWTGSETFGNAATFGKAFGTGENTQTGTTGFSEVVTGSEKSVANCGTCADGDFTGRIFGTAIAGQQSFVTTTGDGYVEGGTVAQAMTELGGHWYANRSTSPAE